MDGAGSYTWGMSAAPRYPAEFGIVGLRMTAEEYLALGETEERTELIEGLVVMSPSPNLLHQRLQREIAYQIESYCRRSPGAEVFFETDVFFSRREVYRPDIVAYAPGRLDPRAKRLEIPPSLVIEVISPGSEPMDLVTKRLDYGRFGVGEYWVVDPRARCVRAPVPGREAMEDISVGLTRLRSASLPGFDLDLRPLREMWGPGIADDRSEP